MFENNKYMFENVDFLEENAYTDVNNFKVRVVS